MLIFSPSLGSSIEPILPQLTGWQIFALSNSLQDDESILISWCETLNETSTQGYPDHVNPNVRFGVNGNDAAILIYTSGTTGMPKAAIITHMRTYSMRKTFNSPLFSFFFSSLF